MNKYLLGAVMVTALLLGCSVVEVGGLKNPYFPLAEGNTWVYEVSGNEYVDTLLCTITETQPGIYAWKTWSRNESGSVSLLGVDIVEGSEPFNDSTRIRVDSLLSWDGARITLPLEPSLFNYSNETVKTPAGVFNQCLLAQGQSDTHGNRFDALLAYDVGPVQVFHRSGDRITRIYRLISYQLAE